VTRPVFRPHLGFNMQDRQIRGWLTQDYHLAIDREVTGLRLMRYDKTGLPAGQASGGRSRPFKGRGIVPVPNC
jgi:hypothetical protein